MNNDPTGPAAEGLPSVSRRQAIKALASGAFVGLTSAAIVATTSCAPSEAPAAEFDPILDAIAAHREVNDTIDSMSGDEAEWEGMLEAEAKAYEAVCQIVPTTLDGICRKAAHMARVGVYGIPSDQVNVALTSLATAAASLGRAA